MTGHIDHGKSTVIGRLLMATNSLPADKIKELNKISKEFGKETELAYLADQLKEERERNITIETTEIFLKSKKRDYRLIDTPGHLEFIRNMLTGASHADAAVLVVDVNEGIREQTRRHAYLIKLLSLPQVLIVLNKMDMLDYRQDKFEEIREKILTFFHELGAGFVDLIPVSAREGENIHKRSAKMKWFKGPTLLKAIDSLKGQSQFRGSALRLPVQDLFPLDGQQIVLGKIVSGTLRKNDEVSVWPIGRNTRISEIKVFGAQKTAASCPESIGLVLDPEIPVKRGDVICADSNVVLPKSFSGNIFWMAPEPLRQGETVDIRCATQQIRCEVAKIEKRIDPASLEMLEQDAPLLNENEAGLVEFRLLEPALVENYLTIPELGRYTIERDNNLHGAGTVIAALC